MNTRFVITRRTHWWMNYFPLTVYLDDIEIGRLYNNEYVDYTLVQHEQYVHVAIKSWGFFEKKIDLHLKPVDCFELEIVSSWSHVVKSLAFIAALLSIHFVFNHRNREAINFLVWSAVLLYQLIGYGAVTFIDTRYDGQLLVPNLCRRTTATT